MVNKLKFKVTSSFNGTATYQIYEGFGCSGNTITSGSTKIIDGESEVIVNNITITDEEISIKVIDSKNCDKCRDKTVSIAVCTPFNGTAVYVDP